MVFKDYKVKNASAEPQAQDSDKQRQRSPLVLASKSPNASPALHPVDETRQAVPIEDVDFELLEEAAEPFDGMDGSRPRADSNSDMHVAQAPSGIGKDEPAYVVPTTPSPFMHSAFNPSVVPPFGYGYPMSDMGLPPPMGDPGQCPGFHVMPMGAYDGGFGCMYGWPVDTNGVGACGGAVPSSGDVTQVHTNVDGQVAAASASSGPQVASESPTASGGAAATGETRRSRRTPKGGTEEKAENGARTSAAPKGADSAAGAAPAAEVSFPHAKGTYTTVMLRNIPNKYTREMLIKQLNQDFRGQFDFMYLPIDFKNKCNVGYGFINFRTPEHCDTFVSRFHGVDVRKCLPGMNSRKVVEVTPARVQGLVENVRRLKNSPVMNQLVDHPEWMPLLFNEAGEQEPFPNPDQPLPPVKPRGRNREKQPDV